jgi:hypothetical protein
VADAAPLALTLERLRATRGDSASDAQRATSARRASTTFMDLSGRARRVRPAGKLAGFVFG